MCSAVWRHGRPPTIHFHSASVNYSMFSCSRSVCTKWSRRTRAEASFMSLSTPFYLKQPAVGPDFLAKPRMRETAREIDPAGDRLPDEVGLATMLEHLRISPSPSDKQEETWSPAGSAISIAKQVGSPCCRNGRIYAPGHWRGSGLLSPPLSTVCCTAAMKEPWVSCGPTRCHLGYC